MDSAEGYRNGYGKPRRLAMSSGTITLRRPRVRGVEERFESRVLPLFARRTKELGALLPELYLHGLAEGDFELAMRGLLGEGAPLSKSSIRRLRAGWTAEFEEWSQRRLEGREVVYVWADGIYVKAGLERDKAALLVVLGAMRDGTKEVLALRSGYRESVESWSEVLRDLKARGIEALPVTSSVTRMRRVAGSSCAEETVGIAKRINASDANERQAMPPPSDRSNGGCKIAPATIMLHAHGRAQS